MALSPSSLAWNEQAMTADLVKLVAGLPRIRLDRLDAQRGPGAYLHWLASRRASEVFGEVVGTGCVPAYVGLARTLRERQGRYTLALRGPSGLRASEIYVTMIPCSWPQASYAEAALIPAVGPPPLQGLGWGSKIQGSKRRSRLASIDCLFPRHWALRPTVLETAAARLRVLSWLCRLDPAGRRWPAVASEQ